MTPGRAPDRAAPFAATADGPPPGRERAVLLLGLVLSLALHGALVAAGAAWRTAPAPSDAPVEIVFLELPPPGLVAPLVAPRPTRPELPAAPRPPAASRPREGARHAGGAEGRPPAAAGPAPAEVSSWLFAPGPRETRGPGLALSPREAARLGGFRVGSGPSGGEVVKSAGPAPQPAGQRVQAMLDEARAAYQAQTPDTYWTPVRDRMAERFVPSWAVFDAEGGSKATSIGRVLSGYLDAAGRYGRAETSGGRARTPPGSGPGTADAPLDDRNPFFRELVVLVRVEQRLDGTLERVQLAQSCGYRELDRMALEAARAAVEERAATATPPQGRRTLWAFTAHYEVIPPAPVVGCPLDAIWTADFSRCAWPLKRTTSARVELRGID